jgi:hypothetical protein
VKTGMVHQEPATGDVIISEMTTEIIDKTDLSRSWRQAFLKVGEDVESGVIKAGESSIVASRIAQGFLVVQCLSCDTLFSLDGCRLCGNGQLQVVHRIESDGVTEHAFLCRICGAKSNSTWTCPRCAAHNPYHLTTGVVVN